MNKLDEWNQLPEADAIAPILSCCGSRAFATEVARARPFADAESLFAAADRIWWTLDESHWREAFASHPRIGESASEAGQFADWSREEQSDARTSTDSVLHSIAEKNREYERRHGFLYIVCASGKSAEELLAILDRRLGNSAEIEIKEATEQQRQITQLRLRKWLDL